MTSTPTAAARVSGMIKALYERACDLVHHEADCPARGRGDEYCKCDAVPFLNDFEALAAIQPDPEPQPVAWRYRSVVKPTCWSNVTEYRRTAYARIGMEEQPLYATPSSADALNIGNTDSHSPSSAGTVSVEAAAKEALAEIERQFADVGVKPENMAPKMVLKRLRALAGEGGR